MLGPGEMLFAPRTPHSIESISPETGRELILSSPANLRCFHRGVTGAMTPAEQDFKTIAAKHGIEFLAS